MMHRSNIFMHKQVARWESQDNLGRNGGNDDSSAEEAFDYLDAPLKRIAVMDTPIPVAPASENYVLPNEKRIVDATRETINL